MIRKYHTCVRTFFLRLRKVQVLSGGRKSKFQMSEGTKIQTQKYKHQCLGGRFPFEKQLSCSFKLFFFSALKSGALFLPNLQQNQKENVVVVELQTRRCAAETLFSFNKVKCLKILVFSWFLTQFRPLNRWCLQLGPFRETTGGTFYTAT